MAVLTLWLDVGESGLLELRVAGQVKHQSGNIATFEEWVCGYHEAMKDTGVLCKMQVTQEYERVLEAEQNRMVARLWGAQ